jgi:hypothetical protein
MIQIDGVYFENYKIKKVCMDLDTCKVYIDCEFYSKDKIRKKEFVRNSDCDVNIDKIIEDLEQIIKDGSSIL